MALHTIKDQFFYLRMTIFHTKVCELQCRAEMFQHSFVCTEERWLLKIILSVLTVGFSNVLRLGSIAASNYLRWVAKHSNIRPSLFNTYTNSLSLSLPLSLVSLSLSLFHLSLTKLRVHFLRGNIWLEALFYFKSEVFCQFNALINLTIYQLIGKFLECLLVQSNWQLSNERI